MSAKLEEEIKRLREALESIASKHAPDHASEAYWVKRGIRACAIVIAADTAIAREALAKDSK